MTNEPSILDPDRVYVRPAVPDANWHEVEVDIPPELLPFIQLIVDSPQFPEYQSISDFVQDAMVHEVARTHDETDDPEVRAHLGSYLREVAAEEEAHRATES